MSATGLLHNHHARRADLLPLLDHTLGDAALVGMASAQRRITSGVQAETVHRYSRRRCHHRDDKKVAQNVRMEASPVIWKFSEATGGEGKGSVVDAQPMAPPFGNFSTAPRIALSQRGDITCAVQQPSESRFTLPWWVA
jgi:hypothetical protein